MNYLKPTVLAISFTCPHCGVLSKQDWWCRTWGDERIFNRKDMDHEIKVGHCHACSKRTLWIDRTMYFPDNGNAPLPNPDMPENVAKLYSEATSIQNKSPRGAAALLRLAVQLLCKELGESGKNLNEDIASLVTRGLPPLVQESLDSMRVIGNNAVHPGQIDVDNDEIVNQLFLLLNVIVQYMISLPNQVRNIYNDLPQESLDGINKRDTIN